MGIKSKPTQIKIDGLRVVDFFDNEFIGIIEKRFPSLKFQHFCMYLCYGEEKKFSENLTIAHAKPINEENQELIVDADEPDSLIKILKAIEEFVDKKIAKIKKKLILTTEESLSRFWDNEYDNCWDSY